MQMAHPADRPHPRLDPSHRDSRYLALDRGWSINLSYFFLLFSYLTLNLNI